MSIAIVLLAAGSGSWSRSNRPKVLHEIGGKPLLAHVIRAASGVVPASDIYVVVGENAELIERAFVGTGVNFVRDIDRRQTGHAIESASDSIAAYDDVVVMPGDLPLVSSETLKMLLDYHRLGAAMSVLTASGKFTEEEPARPAAPPGIYAFQTGHLLARLPELVRSDWTEESTLADLAKILAKVGEQVTAVEGPASELLGADTIAGLVALDAAIRAANAQRLMAEGVTIYKPESCVIDSDVEVGPDTVIEPGVQLLGRTRIGSDCFLRSGTVVENSTIGNGVLIRQSCIISESEVEDGAKIGPFAHLRPGSQIGVEAHIGNFVETKNARLGKGAKASHLTYLGDAEVGAATNIGAGVITCNYDGVNKHRTVIGAGAFIGSDSTLVAPISIGDGAYVGAGSCITREVPANALAVGRSRQVTKEGWATQKRARLEIARLETAKPETAGGPAAKLSRADFGKADPDAETGNMKRERIETLGSEC